MPTTTVGGPLPKEARQGRQNQKYGESGERLLAGYVSKQPRKKSKRRFVTDAFHFVSLMIPMRQTESKFS